MLCWDWDRGFDPFEMAAARAGLKVLCLGSKVVIHGVGWKVRNV